MEKLFDLILSERGQVGNDESAAQAQDEGNPETGQAVAPEVETEAAQTDVTQGQEEHFLTGEENLDPRKLDPSLQPIFKRMQGVYTKRMQEIAGVRERAEVVDRFYNDQAFAEQVLRQWAQQNGYQLSQANGQNAPAQEGPIPPYLVEAFKQNLAPELQWMAEPQAKAMWQALQGMLNPIMAQQQATSYQQRASEWDKHANDLANIAPGWEEREDAMGNIHDFMKSDALHHPVYGSKIKMLYDLATAQAASLKQAQQRVQSAKKNKVSSSQPSTRTSSVEDEILKANSQDAWEILKRRALE